MGVGDWGIGTRDAGYFTTLGRRRPWGGEVTRERVGVRGPAAASAKKTHGLAPLRPKRSHAEAPSRKVAKEGGELLVILPSFPLCVFAALRLCVRH